MSLYSRGFPADEPYSYATIERIACRVRKIIAPCINWDEALPGTELFEKLGSYKVSIDKKDVPIVYEVKEDSVASVEALTRYDQDSEEIIITLLESTYQNLEQNDSRARFTLCHEIAHPVLHLSLLVRLSNIPHRQAALFRGERTQHPQYLDTEWQADAFAAALLMPAQGLAALEKRGMLSRRNIEQHFKVSTRAAEIRLKIFTQRKGEL